MVLRGIFVQIDDVIVVPNGNAGLVNALRFARDGRTPYEWATTHIKTLHEGFMPRQGETLKAWLQRVKEVRFLTPLAVESRVDGRFTHSCTCHRYQQYAHCKHGLAYEMHRGMMARPALHVNFKGVKGSKGLEAAQPISDNDFATLRTWAQGCAAHTRQHDIVRELVLCHASNW